MTEIAVEIDEHNRDVLYARRVELFFEPREDGEPSLDGKVVWHTEWWHYSGALLRGKSIGPRVERQVVDILGESYPVEGGTLDATAIIAGIKSAFMTHAREDLGLPDPEPLP